MEGEIDLMDEKEYQQYQDKKEYLMSYKKACKRIESLKEQLNSLQEIEQSVRSQQISDMPKGGGRQQDLSDLMVKLEDLQIQIADAITESCKIKLEIEEALWKLEDPGEARVLRFRYIYFMPWEEISRTMNYSRKQIQRIHQKAIQNLKDVPQCPIWLC